MINYFKKIVQMLSKKFSQNNRLSVNAENEYQAMSCGSFNPRLLAMIKRNKVYTIIEPDLRGLVLVVDTL